MKKNHSLSFVAFAILGAMQAHANQTIQETLTITATRQSVTLDEVPRSITVIDREELDLHLHTSRNLGEVLAKTVPGMAPASQTLTNFNQTLRGRNVLVLIDGIPQTINRNFSRDFSGINPLDIERIEVVRGGTAAYGSGAAGGVINIISRSTGQPTSTQVQLGSSLTEIDTDTLNGQLYHQTGGSFDGGEYGFGIGIQQNQGFYDANSDRIAPEPSQGDLSDTRAFSLTGKLAFELSEDTSISILATHFDSTQDSDYVSDPATATVPKGNATARPLKGLSLDQQNETRNTLLNLALTSDALNVGTLESQLYFRDYYGRFSPYVGSAYLGTTRLTSTPIQNYMNSQSYGGRVSIDTPLMETSSLLWGVDINREETENLVSLYDKDAYASSGGLNHVYIGEGISMPLTTHDTVALFAQFDTYLTDNLRWEIGARQEWIKLSFDDFLSSSKGEVIHGGDNKYEDLLFNTGLVYSLTDNTQLYANFAQGYSLPDIGLRLRHVAPDYKVSDTDFKAIKSDDYELGFRGDWSHFSATAALFLNETDLGNPALETINGEKYIYQPRVPERVFGVELTSRYQLNKQWSLGGDLTWMEGESESKGEWKALNGFRIPPLQLHAYVAYQSEKGWNHKIQANYSGSRDKAAEDLGANKFGAREVEAYTTFDYTTQLETDKGVFSLGIENLLNNDYHTVYGQLLRNNNNTSHIPATGATLRLSYQYFW